MDKNRTLAILATCLSAFLIYLSFPNFFNLYGFWPLAWIGLVPYFYILGEYSLADRLKIGLLFSFVSFALLVNWLLPLNFLGYLAFIAGLSVGPVLFSIFFPCPFKNRLMDVLYCPVLWVACEYLRTLIMGGFSWTLGYSQSFHINAIQIANLFGSYGISFILVLFNYSLCRIFKDYEHRYVYSAAAVISVFVLFVYGYFSIVSDRQKDDPFNMYEICTVQPNISPQEKWDAGLIHQVIDKHISLSRQCLVSNAPDMVVWPETSIPDDFIKDKEMRAKITQIAQEINTHLLVGAALLENNQDYNSAVLLNRRGAVLDIYRKIYLIPFSEYLPLKFLFGFLREIFNFNIYDFYPGQNPGIFSILKKGAAKEYLEEKFGVALCSEGFYPAIFRNFVSKQCGFVVVMLNDGWFKAEAALVMHAQSEIMRAVENRIPIIRAANSGWSCSIDPFGRVKHLTQSKPALNTKGFYLSHVYPNNQATFYNRYGDIFPVGCLLFVIIVSVLRVVIEIRQRLK